MNCEKYQELLSDLVDGLLSNEDRARIEAHMIDCVACTEVRDDFLSSVEFCQDQRGQYDAVPNERALWLRISNTIEAETTAQTRAQIPGNAGWWVRLMNTSWQLSFPKLAALVAALVAVVSVATVFTV